MSPSSSTLVTGGAGFIGSAVVQSLLDRGSSVRVYDSLVEQVHGPAPQPSLPDGVEFIHADVRDRDALAKALRGVDQVVHLAAEVGVGQSMYEISRYVDANTSGTGALLDILANDHTTVERLVVASSMSVYGEGSYICNDHGSVCPKLRTESQLAVRAWEMQCPDCGSVVRPVATAEDKPLQPTSVYAISKMDQELLCLSVCGAYGIGAVALRYFNTYGPGQALSNPYTGVGAIFSSRLMNGKPPLAFEDGLQRRDFIHVRDVARATVTALEEENAYGEAINVGVGNPLTILEIGKLLANELGVDIETQVTEKYRVGDIRHCYASTQRAEKLLAFSPSVPLEEGIHELIEWVRTQQSVDSVDAAYAELGSRGLAI